MEPDLILFGALGGTGFCLILSLVLLILSIRARGRLARRVLALQEDGETLRRDLSRLEVEHRVLGDQQASLRAELERREAELARTRETESGLRTRLAEVETAQAKDREAQQEKIRELTNVREGIEKDLKILTDALLKENSETFFKRAKETFEAQNAASQKGVEGLLKPVQETLKAYEEKLRVMEEARKRDEGALSQQVQHLLRSNENLKDTTTNLVNALQAAPKTRGRWGEQQLKTVLEMAGMTEHIDFETEYHIAAEDGPLRPDVILRLPGDRRIVVDAKTPMAAYLDAVNSPSEDDRDRLLADHARQLKTHAQQLGSKEYWNNLTDTPDFVVMFVPGDNLYAAAIERDPALFDFAYDKKVIIATPTTFLALAKAVAFGWRQEQASRDARKVLEEGAELYKRVKKLVDNMSGLSRAIDQTVKKHNQLVGSLQTRVLPSARRMHGLGVGMADGVLPSPDDAREHVRFLTASEEDADTEDESTTDSPELWSRDAGDGG